ncbi:MAG: amidohydrolase [Saprospirales bacterium]|jgi:omega-amidase|nr:amidohydrolase [Saprospirales bacterium]
MRITILQTQLHWEAPAANRAGLAEILAPLAGTTDLAVLPEMFSTGFSMQAAALAEPMEGPTGQWLRNQARLLGAAITGSFICREEGRYFNRLLFARPDGSIDCYDKRHLFSLANEHETYTAGQKSLVLGWLGWRICPLICYDLRFPVWSRQTPAAPYDLLLYVANWPARRGHHWRSLLPARAIENQSYVAAVNIVGTDGNGLEYAGDSGIWDYSGQAVCHIGAGMPGIFTAELSLDALRQYRAQLPFLGDSDAFQLER